MHGKKLKPINKSTWYHRNVYERAAAEFPYRLAFAAIIVILVAIAHYFGWC